MIGTKLEDLARRSGFHFRDLMLEVGVLPGHRDYCRFIILSRGRSGSTFLNGLLNSHRQIVSFGELFRFYDSIGWDLGPYDRYWQSARLLSLSQRDAVGFLERRVFTKYPRQISAVGFKMFYYHARDDSRQPVWPFLQSQRDLRVIHLKRSNTLDVIVSEKKAFMTDRWVNNIGAKEQPFSISLDYNECLQRFSREEQMQEEGDAYFAGSHMLEVFYEDLAADYEREIGRVLDFLGVSREPVRPSTYKQSSQRLSEAISNYWELKGMFSGTEWENFFED